MALKATAPGNAHWHFRGLFVLAISGSLSKRRTRTLVQGNHGKILAYGPVLHALQLVSGRPQSEANASVSEHFRILLQIDSSALDQAIDDCPPISRQSLPPVIKALAVHGLLLFQGTKNPPGWRVTFPKFQTPFSLSSSLPFGLFSPVRFSSCRHDTPAFGTTQDARQRSYSDSFLRMISVTIWGLAEPLVAAITWPIRNLITFSFPDLKSATESPFLVNTSSMTFSNSPASLT